MSSNTNSKRADDIELSIVIPCYNEENAIVRTVEEVAAAIASCGRCEIIVVDDGSSDRSVERLEQASARFPMLSIVRQPRNRGYGAALKLGIQYARGAVLGITDADATYPNHRLPDLVDILYEQDAEMVVGARIGENVTYSWLRRIPKALMRVFCEWIARQEVADMNSGLRVFRSTRLREFVRYLPNGFSFTTTITLAMMTNDHRVVYEPIDYTQRIGDSKINPIRDTILFFQLIIRTGLYFAPMRVFGPPLYAFWTVFAALLIADVVGGNIRDMTLLVFNLAFNLTLVAALADMIHKKD